MKILMFTPYVPYPPNSGGQTRTFNLIKNLSLRNHEITSICFLRADQTEPDLNELKKYCLDVKIVRRKKAFSSPGKILVTGISLFPYLANMYRYDRVRETIGAELENRHYDLIHVETYYIMPNIPKTTVPVLLSEQTIEYLVYQHYTQTTPYWFLKPLLYVDVLKHKYWEQSFWQKAQKVVAMSGEDRKKMLALEPNLDAGIVPNGVDVDWFAQRVSTERRTKPRLLFLGNFNWLQNREAVDILVSRIWPLIKSKLPQASLWIVGREPTDKIKKLAEMGDITISSDVEDIRVAYQSSDVLVAPLFGSGGTRYKILEAMASGLPVVSTKIGIEGLGVKSGVHALISDDVATIADYAVEMSENFRLRPLLIKNAKRLVGENYDWRIITADLEKIYEEIIRKKN